MRRKEEELTFTECKDLINQIFSLKVSHLIFSGGEPLLRDDIFDLIKYARGKPIKMVDVITNGLLINKKTAEALAGSGTTHITVSIDGIGAVNDVIRGKGVFRRAVNAIDLINKYRNNGIPTVGINFTIMNCNIDQIIPMVELARGKGCNIVVFQPLLCNNVNMQERSEDELWVSERNIPKLGKIIKEVIKLKRGMRDISIHVDDRILEMIPDYFARKPLENALKCYDGIVRIVIGSNGGVWACGGDYGNIKTKSLRNCWISPEARRMRQRVKRCSNHCLQSCIHLNGLSDIYSKVRGFLTLLGNRNEAQEYLTKTLALLRGYRFLLERRILKSSRSMPQDGRGGYVNEWRAEVKRISMLMDESA